jgi:uncharacterized membrane protein
MQGLFKELAAFIALGVETAAVVIIAFGALETLATTIRVLVTRKGVLGHRKELWLRFAMWLMLGLEFELAADVVRTAISPTWTDIGQLAAIGGIRTFLNYFLERDLETLGKKSFDAFAPPEAAAPPQTRAAVQR